MKWRSGNSSGRLAEATASAGNLGDFAASAGNSGDFADTYKRWRTRKQILAQTFCKIVPFGTQISSEHGAKLIRMAAR